MSEKTELLKQKKQLENQISRYKNLQLAKKVQLNSAYGALATSTLDSLICDKQRQLHFLVNFQFVGLATN